MSFTNYSLNNLYQIIIKSDIKPAFKLTLKNNNANYVINALNLLDYSYLEYKQDNVNDRIIHTALFNSHKQLITSSYDKLTSKHYIAFWSNSFRLDKLYKHLKKSNIENFVTDY